MHEYTEYKGNKILVLKKTPEDKYPFHFGKAKAQLIMSNIEEVQRFANEL